MLQKDSERLVLQRGVEARWMIVMSPRGLEAGRTEAIPEKSVGDKESDVFNLPSFRILVGFDDRLATHFRG